MNSREDVEMSSRVLPGCFWERWSVRRVSMDFRMEALSPMERAEMEVVRRDCGEASCGEEGMVWLAVVCEVSKVEQLRFECSCC